MFEIAFGLSKYLNGFKRIIPQADNFNDLGLEPYADDFAEQLLSKMNDAEKIHFNLTGMLGLNGPNGVLKGPIELNPVGSANWELRTIWDNLELGEKTAFYLSGQEISIDEILQLD